MSGDNIKIDIYEGQSGQSITLELLNAKLGFAQSGQSQGKSQQQNSGQHSSQQSPPNDWDIPF
ncbi:TPA: hypothetical protein SMI07_000682 [Serratia liquefaciens]|nr:hypothetical protein [Serratia liquefaciens]